MATLRWVEQQQRPLGHGFRHSELVSHHPGIEAPLHLAHSQGKTQELGLRNEPASNDVLHSLLLSCYDGPPGRVGPASTRTATPSLDVDELVGEEVVAFDLPCFGVDHHDVGRAPQLMGSSKSLRKCPEEHDDITPSP